MIRSLKVVRTVDIVHGGMSALLVQHLMTVLMSLPLCCIFVHV